jgi:hypothetical protein
MSVRFGLERRSHASILRDARANIGKLLCNFVGWQHEITTA